MTKHKCELCSSPVEVVGDTTKHYRSLLQDRVDALEKENIILMEAIESIGVVIDGEIDERDSIANLVDRWKTLDTADLLETMAEDTRICRKALKKVKEIRDKK